MDIILLRGTHLAALMLLFGTIELRLLPERELHGDPAARLAPLAQAAAGAALLLGAGWLVLVARGITGATGWTETLSGIAAVVQSTQFGTWLLVRLALLAVAIGVVRCRPTWALAASGLALTIQPFLAHAGAVIGPAGTVLIAAEALHLLAAGAWLGGLVPLALLLRRLPPLVAARVCRRFSTLSLGAVVVLVATGLTQATVLLGGLAALGATAYGHALLVKLALIASILTLGAANRFRLIPLLPATRAALAISLAAETGVGLGIVIAAAWLASLAPAGSAAQSHPIWYLIAAIGAAGGIALAVSAASPRFSRT